MDYEIRPLPNLTPGRGYQRQVLIGYASVFSASIEKHMGDLPCRNPFQLRAFDDHDIDWGPLLNIPEKAKSSQ